LTAHGLDLSRKAVAEREELIRDDDQQARKAKRCFHGILVCTYFYRSLQEALCIRELRIGKLFSPADAGIRVRFPSSRGPEEVNTTAVISRRRRRKERCGQMNKRRQHAGYLAACVGVVDRMRKAGQRPYMKYASQEAGCCNLLATRGADIKYLCIHSIAGTSEGFLRG
jgi:hypothetical protein